MGIAEKSLSWLKSQKLAQLDAFINKKLWWMDETIRALHWQFADRFIWTLKEIDEHASAYEASALVWKANQKKQDFFCALSEIKGELKTGLTDIKTGALADMDDEWQALIDALEESRQLLISESDRLSQSLWDGAQGIADDLDWHANKVSDWLD